MATSIPLKKPDPFLKERNYIKRLVYDVLAYTLSKCGLPHEELPYTSQEENVYHRAGFIESVGVTTLHTSLLLRDKWKEEFLWTLTYHGLSDENIVPLLERCVQTYPLCFVETGRSIMFASLAVGNEFILFLYHTGILNIDLKVVLDAIYNWLFNVAVEYMDDPNIMEIILDCINYDPYRAEWITLFTERYGIPYGSKEDFSDLFFAQVKFVNEALLKDIPETLTLEQLRTTLGYLPISMFDLIEYRRSADLPEEASGQNFLGDNESSKSQNLPPNPADEAIGGKEFRDDGRSIQSENVSEQAAQGGEELGMEDNLREENLTPAVSQANQGAIPKRRKPKKDPRGKQSTSSPIASEQIVQSGKKLGIDENLGERHLAAVTSQASQGDIPKRRKPIKEFHGIQSTSSDIGSDQIVEIGEKLGIEEDLGKMSLASEETSQLTESAISKSIKPIQETLMRQSTLSDNGYEQIAQRGKKLETEDGIGKMVWATEESFHVGRGVISKQKKVKEE